MSVPIIGQQPEGICVVCRGVLSPTHQHVYIDKAERDYMDAILNIVVRNECVIPTTEGLLPAHPRLADGYMWYPVPITHMEHEGCRVKFPHHHCEVENNGDLSGYSTERRSEVPASDPTP